MNTRKPESGERDRILRLDEDHFNDLKSVQIKPATLQETFVAFANSDGGDLYVGVEDKKILGERIIGFPSIEAANDIIHTLLEETNPAVENMEMNLLISQKMDIFSICPFQKAKEFTIQRNKDVSFG